MWRWPFLAAPEAVAQSQGAFSSSRKYLRHSRSPPHAALAHAPSFIGHSFATQYFTISRLPCPAAALIVHAPHSHFFSSRIHLSNSSLFVRATFAQNIFSPVEYGHRFSHANSKVDIDDISETLKLFFKSSFRDDLLINALVSLFTPYKNFTSVRFNLGKMCSKQTSSLSTITSHKAP